MDIVFCTDNNYAMPCGIAMISVLENNRNTPIAFHIVGMDLKEESKGKISSILNNYNEASVSFYEIKKEFLDSYNLSLFGSKYLSISAYSRLFLAEILPKGIDKVLYLDCDIIVCKSLLELWNIDIDNNSIAGVPDLMHYKSEVFDRLGYNDTYGYVNSGILLINLRYWREHNQTEIFLSYYKEKHDNISAHDQDIINGTLYDTKLLLPIKFNVIDFYFLTKKKNVFQYEKEISEAIKNPVIIHYTSTSKPWLKSCVHSLKDEFFKYKNISPWKEYILTWDNISLSNRIKYYKRITLYKLKLKKARYIKQ